MSPTYDDILIQATDLLVHALLEREDDLPEQAIHLDTRVQGLLQDLGLRVMQALFQALVIGIVAPFKVRGFTPDARKPITVDTLFGALRIDSPYLRNGRDS